MNMIVGITGGIGCGKSSVTDLLKKLNIDFVIIIRFKKIFSRIKAEKFIKKIISERIGAKYIFVSRNFKFGRNKSDAEKQKNVFENLPTQLYNFFMPPNVDTVQNQFSETKKLEDKAVENLINKIHQNLLVNMSDVILTK